MKGFSVFQQSQESDELFILYDILNVQGVNLFSKRRYFKLKICAIFLLFSKTCFLRSLLAFWQDENPVEIFPMLICALWTWESNKE